MSPLNDVHSSRSNTGGSSDSTRCAGIQVATNLSTAKPTGGAYRFLLRKVAPIRDVTSLRMSGLIGNRGHITVYNASFEVQCFDGIAHWFPDHLAWVEEIRSHVWSFKLFVRCNATYTNGF